MLKKGLVVLAVALVAGAMWVSWGRGSMTPVDAVGRAASESSTMVASRAPSPNTSPGSAAETDDTGRQPIVPTGAPLAVVHGRCVDEAGLPLAGVHVTLRGDPANTDRMHAYVLEHGPPHWQPLEPVVTTADGVFRWQLDPPPPYQWSCEASVPGRLSVRDTWSEIECGADFDCGDVVVPTGATLTGDVVDVDGEPVPATTVWFTAFAVAKGVSQRPAGFVPQTSFEVVTDDHGRFTCASRLPATVLRVDVDGRPGVEPARIDLCGGSQLVHLVAEKPRPQAVIAGIVVDEHGQPVGQAAVSTHWRSAAQAGTNTDREGRFELRAPVGLATDRTALRVVATGFDELTTDAVGWGTRGLHLVLRHGLDVEITVRDAATRDRWRTSPSACSRRSAWQTT